MPGSDTLASKLISAEPSAGNRGNLKIALEFADRPEVLESIRRARTDRGLSYEHIAKILSEEGTFFSRAAVRSWLLSEGIS